MTDNATLYSADATPLSVAEIERLCDDAEICEHAHGAISVVWPDVKVTIHSGMDEGQLKDHLNDFCGHLVSMNGGAVDDDIEPLLNRIMDTRLVVGCVVEPGFDNGRNVHGLIPDMLAWISNKLRPQPQHRNKAKSLIVSMACTYDCAIFANNSVYSPYGEVVFGSTNEDYADLSDLVVRKVRMEPVELTENQKQRTERVRAMLSERDVPIYDAHIRWMHDDDDFRIREASSVARRVLALNAIIRFARGREYSETVELLSDSNVAHDLSPAERHFLENDGPSTEACQEMIWRLECLWLLMWSLGYFDDLNWPNQMCDADDLHDSVFDAAASPEDFINSAKLRDRTTLLDTAELVMRIHWAVRDSVINNQPIPENLDWKTPTKLVSATNAPAVGIVQERHHALNWLIGFGDAEWDNVDTPS